MYRKLHQQSQLRLPISRLIARIVVALAAGLLALGLAQPVARAGDTVWGGLILARNVGSPEEAPAQIQPFAAKLKRVFGYNQLQLLGEETKDVTDKGDRWLIPGRDFSLRAAIEQKTSNGYRMQLELFQGKRLLVNTRAELGPGSPLVIRGPLYGDGQLLVLFEVR